VNSAVGRKILTGSNRQRSPLQKSLAPVPVRVCQQSYWKTGAPERVKLSTRYIIAGRF